MFCQKLQKVDTPAGMPNLACVLVFTYVLMLTNILMFVNSKVKSISFFLLMPHTEFFFLSCLLKSINMWYK